MMVTGELPFKSSGPLDAWMKKIHNELTPPRHIMPSLSERVDWAIRRAMNPDPNQRPASCREFVEDLTGHSTRKITPLLDAEARGDQWYLVYKDEDAVVHTVKGTMEGIRRSLKEGLLGDAANVRASRTKGGPFELLRTHPEFRDLAMETIPMEAAKPKTLPDMITPLPPTNSGILSELVFQNAIKPPPLPKRQSQLAPIPCSPAAPLINLRTHHGAGDWVKWLILTLVALASALVSYCLMPRF